MWWHRPCGGRRVRSGAARPSAETDTGGARGLRLWGVSCRLLLRVAWLRLLGTAKVLLGRAMVWTGHRLQAAARAERTAIRSHATNVVVAFVLVWLVCYRRPMSIRELAGSLIGLVVGCALLHFSQRLHRAPWDRWPRAYLVPDLLIACVGALFVVARGLRWHPVLLTVASLATMCGLLMALRWAGELDSHSEHKS